jgi:hypothetical protein
VGRHTDFRPIIACTKLLALLFATEEANKESGLRKATGRNPASARICCSELYEIKLLSAEMTILSRQEVPQKESYPLMSHEEGDKAGCK